MRRITNKDLVKLGFPDVIVKNTYNWKGKKYAGTPSYVHEVIDKFYATAKALISLYNKEIGTEMHTVSRRIDAYSVYLDGELVFSFYQSWRYTYKHQHLTKIKDIVKKLLAKHSFDELREKVMKLSEEMMMKISFTYFLKKYCICTDKRDAIKVLTDTLKKYEYANCRTVEKTNSEEWTFSKEFKVDTQNLRTALRGYSKICIPKDGKWIYLGHMHLPEMESGILRFVVLSDRKIVKEVYPSLILNIL